MPSPRARRPATAPAAPAPAARTAGPGRPKDLAKRAAVLEAAKRMFARHGLDRVSMDQIAAEAGVSKLTVYSHFGDKDRLFAEAVRAHCEQNMPACLFEDADGEPLRERLQRIGEAFAAMVMEPEAIAGHRILCSPPVAGGPLAAVFWEAGPARVQAAFAALLARRRARGELPGLDDAAVAAGHFFALLRGEPHLRAVLGCPDPGACEEARQRHVAAVVALFLRAYGGGPAPPR
ncbi:TetR/AcrR family transcriptional regulator [Thermomonas flagellata]|uniref:TetR/AcrR family transcriptional regulator n=1 Tax=Thermomonas flagellata TaxID=2888524 RepID=UPI001F040232|nr:TetR/AcrR family transcriptional regulator [Thermomonas flagellata]